MIKLFIVSLLLAQTGSSYAQKITPAEECPEPPQAKINELCGSILISEKVEGDDQNYYVYAFEKRLLELACADLRTDSEEEAKDKLNQMWNKYHDQFTCASHINIMKYALDKSYTSFVDALVSTYGLDINFIDPSDNKNLYDYIKDRYLHSYSQNGPEHPRTYILKQNLDMIVVLGGHTGLTSDWLLHKKVIFRQFDNGKHVRDGTIAEIISWATDYSQFELKIIQPGRTLKHNGILLKSGMQIWFPLSDWLPTRD